MRAFLLLLTCWLSVFSARAQAQAVSKTADVAQSLPEKAGLKISIAASYKADVRSITLEPDDPHINVLFQNTSSKPLNLFESWNSWGATNLTLKITEVDGKALDTPLIISKGRLSLLENYPSTESIGPGETIVREVHFHVPAILLNPAGAPQIEIPHGHRYWEFPLPTNEERRLVTMSAVFENKEARNSREGNSSMWTGQIVSQPLSYQIYWGHDIQ